MTRFSAFILISIALVSFRVAAETPEELIEAGHYKRAKAMVLSNSRGGTNTALNAYLQSRIELAFGNLDAAMKQAERSVDLDGRNPKYHFFLGRVCAVSAQKAGMFKAMSLSKRLREEFETTLRLDKRHVDARFGLMLFYLKAPGIAGGDKDKAQSLSDEILAMDPVQGYLAKAQIAREEQAMQKVEMFHRKAVEADPKNYDAQVGLATYYGSQKNYELEKKHGELALAIDSSRASAHARLAEALAATGPQETVDAALEKAEASVPDNLLPYFTAGVALLTQQKDLPRSERYLRKYLSQDAEGFAPSHAVARWRLAQVLEKLGRKLEAVEQLESAVRADPDFDKAKDELKRLK